MAPNFLVFSSAALLASVARADLIGWLGDDIEDPLAGVQLPEEQATCPTENGQGACELEGCADKCIVNADIGGQAIAQMFSQKLLDAIECPLMAVVLTEVITSGGVSRKLQEQGDAIAEAISIAMETVPQGGLPAFNFRSLQQAATPSPAAPGKGCPTPEEVQEAAPILFFVASFFAQAATDSGDYEDTLGNPCKKQYSAVNTAAPAALGVEPGTFEAEMIDMFIALMSDPEKLNAFFKNECTTEVVDGDIAAFYAIMQGIEPPVGPVTTCRDNDGAAEKYFTGLKMINDTCSDVAATVPGAVCIGDAAAPLDDNCMAAYGTLFGLSKADVAAIQGPYKEISDACGSITTAAACQAKSMPQVGEVEAAIAAAVSTAGIDTTATGNMTTTVTAPTAAGASSGTTTPTASTFIDRGGVDSMVTEETSLEITGASISVAATAIAAAAAIVTGR